jgi:hypothetical protein
MSLRRLSSTRMHVGWCFLVVHKRRTSRPSMEILPDSRRFVDRGCLIHHVGNWERTRGEDKVSMALHLWLTSISATDLNSIKKNVHPFYSAIYIYISLSLSLFSFFLLGAGGRCPGRGGVHSFRCYWVRILNNLFRKIMVLNYRLIH